ncbi:expressed unknown protein [Seminavis robusta]|uniref:P-loop containing nucleoside triphosphate hydrolase protein n=1 Tax=Seminavis robusta TaxID=568900 RepID=A0A9N8HD35_9STRA|nr:expressed unknown protein [Seminavis robusta]|eukprot:Sro343_g122060.1 n/a (289) ;mRNA; f:61045-61911
MMLDTTKELPFVIGAGVGRTGTHSLQAALITLGYNKPFHMHEILDGLVDADPWFELAANERATGMINNTLALKMAQNVIDLGYTATTDYPCCFLYSEFLELTNGKGKVILSVRSSPSDWKKSVLDTIGILSLPFFKPPFSFSPFFSQFAGVLVPWLWERTGVANLGQIDVPTESLIDYEDSMEAAYTQWIKTIKKQVPPEQLLIHHAKDGYPPLCKFLGIEKADCPKEDYPHIGDTQEMKQLIRTFEIVTEVFWPVVALLGLLLVLVIRRVMRRNGKGMFSKTAKKVD